MSSLVAVGSICVVSVPWLAEGLIAIGTNFEPQYKKLFLTWIFSIPVCGFVGLTLGYVGKESNDTNARRLPKAGIYVGYAEVGLFALLYIVTATASGIR